MKFTIRWKLMASYLFLILAIGGVLYGYLNHSMSRHVVSEVTEGLLSEIQMARLAAAKEIVDLRRDSAAAASTIAPATRARVTIIDRQGNVVGDSEVPPGELGSLANHSDRPEVVDALRKGRGTAIRYSATLRTSMLYVALPFTSIRGEEGILRLALPLSVLEKTEATIGTIVLAGVALATVIALILSSILTQVASRTLRTMSATAARLGNGELGKRIQITSADELGDLGRVMNDMAGRIEAEVEKLSREKNRLQAILKGMGEGLMVADGNGTITLVNPAFRSLFALTEQVEGKHLFEISRHPALHDAFKVVVETQKERVEEITLTFAEERSILTHWVPLLDQNALQGVVAVFHDISELKKLETIRKDFVANVSHELRTPITVIKGYAEILSSDSWNADAGQVTRFGRKIYTHSERLAALVADLLALSELESNGATLKLAPLRLENAARHAAALLEDRLREKGIYLDVGGVATTPAVLADQGRLEQVLINLLHNAVKFTSPGGTVTVAAAEHANMVRVCVTDSGIGIAPAHLPRLFERFYRVDASRSRAEGDSGTGLGLAIVKHIIQLHGGTVDVESTPGSGSTFSFSLRKA